MTDKFSLNDLVTMAKTLYGEARGTSNEDRQACALVMLNRAKFAAKHRERTGKLRHSLFGDGSVASACLAKMQFSCWNNDDPNRPLLDALVVPTHLATDAPFLRCFTVAGQVLLGDVPDFTKGSLHYHTKRMNNYPVWSVGKTPVFSSSHHHFYNNVD